jgi:hypothetical protein
MVWLPCSTRSRALILAARFLGQLSLGRGLRAAVGLSLKTTVEGLALATVTTPRTNLTTNSLHQESHRDFAS